MKTFKGCIQCKKKKTTVIPPLVYSSNNGYQSIAFSNDDKVYVLNYYFSPISCVDNYGVKLPDMFSLCDSDVDDIVIREQDIIDIITILPSNKAIGPDTISHKVLKSTIYTIVKPLCLLFKRSLNDCIFSRSSKII